MPEPIQDRIHFKEWNPKKKRQDWKEESEKSKTEAAAKKRKRS